MNVNDKGTIDKKLASKSLELIVLLLKVWKQQN